MSEGYDYQQILFRNQHGGVAWDKTKITNQRQVKARLRSSPDKRLVDLLEDQGLMEAFSSIKRAHDMLTAEIRTSHMHLDAAGKVNRPDDFGAIMQLVYRQWVEDCKRRYFSPLMALDVIVHGFSLNETDLKHHFREGTARKNLVNCLTVWVRLPLSHRTHQERF